jgi:hypothetical protein
LQEVATATRDGEEREVYMPVRRIRMLMAWVGLALAPAALAAQTTPVVPQTGTMALEGTMKTFYRGVNKLVVTTVDGMDHVYQFTKDLVVHGGKESGEKALEGMHEGAMVVIHYTIETGEPTVREIDRVSDAGFEVTEARVVRIERGRKLITVRFGDGRTETFQLTERAAAEAPAELETAHTGDTRVVIYFKDEKGQKVVHYFKKAS